MKKIFLLSLLLIPIATNGMEKIEEKIEKALHVVSDALFEEESEEKVRIPDNNNPLEEKITTIKRQLYDAKGWRGIASNDPRKYLVICNFPDHKYGYVEKNNKYYENTLINYNHETLAEMETFINARYEGYSGIGAVLFGVDSTHIKKRTARQLIVKLHKAGMEETKNDIDLAEYLGKSKLLNRD